MAENARANLICATTSISINKRGCMYVDAPNSILPGDCIQIIIGYLKFKQRLFYSILQYPTFRNETHWGFDFLCLSQLCRNENSNRYNPWCMRGFFEQAGHQLVSSQVTTAQPTDEPTQSLLPIFLISGLVLIRDYPHKIFPTNN